MFRLLRCAAGHQWQSDADGAHCPQCGAAALTGAADVTMAPTAPVEDDEVAVEATILPEDAVLPATDVRPGVATGPGTLRTQGGSPPSSSPTVRISPSAAPRIVPGYEILGELGRGGMGVVYRARQSKLNRLVALKMILSGEHAGSQELDRFRTEAEAVASLTHPGIVAIHEVGEHDGRPYFSLEFIDGGSLAGRCNGTPLPPREAAVIMEKLASAMAHAHERGIVHRDLKPANVLMTKDGEPKITDFGLAKKLEGSDQLTASGAVMGTPSYMAPEQAAGRTKAIGPAADIYALGAVLYELLTGRPPFRAASVMDTLMQVMRDEPVPPTRLQMKVPRDLETICLKCLQKEPTRRYPTARALAEDLASYLKGEPIQARPIGSVERAVKWVKRRPAIATLLAMLVLLGITGISLVTWQWREAVRAREEASKRADEATTARIKAETETERADKERVRAEANLTRAEQVVYFSRIALVDREATAGNKTRADALLDACRLDLRRWEWNYLRRSLNEPATTIPGRKSRLSVLTFHPDSGALLAGFDDGTLAVYPRDGSPPRILKAHDTSIHAIACSRDGRLLATGDSTGRIILRNGEGTEVRRELKSHTAAVTGLAFSPDGKTLASVGRDLVGILWNVDDGTPHTFGGHAAPLTCVAISPDGRFVVTGSEDRTVKVWDSKGIALHTFRGHDFDILAVAFSPSTGMVASASSDQITKLWDPATGEVAQTLRARAPLAFSPDGERLAAAYTEKNEMTVRLWDTRTGHEILTLSEKESGLIWALSFDPKGHRLAAGITTGKFPGTSSVVRVWDGTPPRETFVLNDGENSYLHDLAYSPDGTRILTGRTGPFSGSTDLAEVWDTATAQLVMPLRGHLAMVLKVAYHPDGSQIATGSGDRTIILWDAATGKRQHTLIGHTEQVTALAYSPDGTRLASGSGDRTLRLWDRETGKELSRCRHEEVVISVAFTRDGREVIAAGPKKVIVWDAQSGEQRRTLPGLGLVAISPDGEHLATIVNGQISIRLIADGKEVRELKGEALSWSSLAFAPNGRFLAAGSLDGRVRVWDTTTGEELPSRVDRLDPTARGPSPVRVVFSPTGRYLATSYQQRVRVFDAPIWQGK